MRPGQLTDYAIFCFYATKNISCGEGGEFNETRVLLISLMMRLHGMSASAYNRYTTTSHSH